LVVRRVTGDSHRRTLAGMKLAKVICKLTRHQWVGKHGKEGEHFLQCQRCGAIRDTESHMYGGFGG
jgi:hypothetical protein